ncbi:thiamine diphosphokinase [Thermaerobacter composti]|uniref:Thiamine diphosphokinase n=1 Tax=Thermaerobacter composti TaxID=554949 RepID=A0ABZ0QQD5_9FIRM|nr:thiamine diphosphokinase [Thermaerobacter composti]WPD19474.1 thiamine diphosphokinase [Thermaerobacter composti]
MPMAGAAGPTSPFGFLPDPTPPYGVVVAGGDLDEPALAREVARLARDASLCVAADGGLRLLRAVGLWPHVLVGDFDTLTAAEVEAARAAGVEVQTFPAAKDLTDAEIALDAVRRRLGGAPLYLVGGVGDRVDHTLANLLLTARWGTEGRPLTVLSGPAHVRPLVAPGEVRFRGAPGQTVSLVPLTPRMTGVATEGLAYPLADATLAWGTAYTVSNALVGTEGAFRARTGIGLVVLQRRP